jgi:hypothetical protein
LGFAFTEQRTKPQPNLSRIPGKTGGNWFEVGVFLFPALRLTHLDSYSLIEIPVPDGTIGRGGAKIRATRDD